MSKEIILTGLRANNDLHIGHYYGALLPIINMANKKSVDYRIHLFVPDLHSFTTPIDHSMLRDQIMHNLRLFTAAGLPLDNSDVHIYRQSYIPAHSELTWILDCFAGIGEVSRMTQFKDKSSKLGEERISVGLFNYPVLMAADILLYGADYIPVGEDQTQHIEFTRDIGHRMNEIFGQKLFNLPKPVSDQKKFFGKEKSLRLKDLADPTKKMSKSDDTGKGVIFLGDPPETVKKKILAATTDNHNSVCYDPANQPGISNLLEILSLVRGQDILTTTSQFVGQTSYGTFKSAVANEVAEFVDNFQVQLSKTKESDIVSKLKKSEKQMNILANKTLLEVQKAVGIR